VSARTCPSCGLPLPAGARYCVNCGASVPEETVVVAARGGVGGSGAPERVPWHPAEALGVFLVALLLTSLGVFVVAVGFRDKFAVGIVGTLVYEAAMLAAVIGWVRVRYGLGVRALALRGPLGEHFGPGVAVGLIGLVATTVVALLQEQLVESATRRPVQQPDQLGITGHHLSVALAVVIGIVVIVAAPFAEELLFRGFLFRALRKYMKPWPAVLVSAAVFGAVHVIPLVILPIFVLGVIFAWVVEKRGSIVPTIVAHMVFNTFGFVVQVVIPMTRHRL
jgi:membrane protease YdiL (CAAX protease family)